ncbi:nuclear factor related to kappa-B-binding protein [Ditylenchus destructor]|uniref:Nuclear factor related to kappa-B-binding protein n=1 Tax=Ditylenchus destructor TaxID=166010 RepID=A0AAD4MGS2_9BILA|nr:nuclear factor related to kappa-B-binding protein [Ditylenchus destructor]
MAAARRTLRAKEDHQKTTNGQTLPASMDKESKPVDTAGPPPAKQRKTASSQPRAPRTTAKASSAKKSANLNTKMSVNMPGPSSASTSMDVSSVPVKDERPTTYLPLRRLCLGGETVDVPERLLNDEELFRDVITPSAYWSLSEQSRKHLRRFLPGPVNSKDDEEISLNCAFTENPNFCFGNPISKVFRKIKSGYFSGLHAADQVQLRDHRRVLYDHYIRHYYMNLLKKLLIGRQVILENATKSNMADKIEITPSNYMSKNRLKSAKELQKRAANRAQRMIHDCKNKVGESGTSSDDEEESDSSHVNLAPGAASTLHSKKFSEHDLDLHQPTRMKDVKELLKEYKHLRETEPDCPSLDISDITLEEVYDRVGICYQSEKNFAQSVSKSRTAKEERSATLPLTLSDVTVKTETMPF